MRRLLCLALVVPVMLAPSAGAAATSPSKFFVSMLAAGERQQSVRVGSVQNEGAGRIVQVTDAGRTQGVQQITYTNSGQTGHVTVLVTGGNAYVVGDAFTLANYMGFNADAAAAYAGQWIEIPSTDPDFKAVASDVTLSSAIGDLSVPQPVEQSPSTVIAGRIVTGVTGTQPAAAGSTAMMVSFFARETGTPLPVEEIILKGSYQATVTFSNWNERVRLTIPTHATLISTVGLVPTTCSCAS
jgi:hypothetical protein